ncbi:MAG: hypothetical protein LBE86_15765 [Gemmobacter sp.]|jgi:molybdopterin-guanine dinucleotide biosynthesis protein B|nr:hypothetical protein [Gemmobacter sp.]
MRGLNVAVVDWSAASKPSPRRPSADAIWLGLCTDMGEVQHYRRTRAEAEGRLAEVIAEGEWLVGFDFPMGYPEGFAARLTGQPGASMVWNWLEARIKDGPDNCNNRFDLAAAINRRFGGGPFWGRPAGLDLPDLAARKSVDYPALGLPERRRVERVVPRAQPVWKLFTTGSVGSQALMGLPLVARLARRPDVAVWPFTAVRRVTLAEVYPSLLGPLVGAAPEIKDRAQVRLLARALHRLVRAGRLGSLLADVPPDALPDEGWIIGAGHAALLREAATWP